MHITLNRKSGALFEAQNDRGQSIVLDGPADIGGVLALAHALQSITHKLDRKGTLLIHFL